MATKPSVRTIASKWLRLANEGLPPKLRQITPKLLCKICWSCGVEGLTLERAHITPKSAGGLYSSLNLWLLCKYCHSEQPEHDGDAKNWSWFMKRPMWTGSRIIVLSDNN